MQPQCQKYPFKQSLNRYHPDMQAKAIQPQTLPTQADINKSDLYRGVKIPIDTVGSFSGRMNPGFAQVVTKTNNVFYMNKSNM